MNIALWIIAGLLAIAFLAGGAVKLISRRRSWPPSPCEMGRRLQCRHRQGHRTLEVLAAVGLILPAVLDIAPVLVPLAAVGLVLLMVGAMITHLRRHEAKQSWWTWSCSPWPSSWRGAASAPSPSPADPVRRLATPPHRACLRYQPPDVHRTSTGLV